MMQVRIPAHRRSECSRRTTPEKLQLVAGGACGQILRAAELTVRDMPSQAEGEQGPMGWVYRKRPTRQLRSRSSMNDRRRRLLVQGSEMTMGEQQTGVSCPIARFVPGRV